MENTSTPTPAPRSRGKIMAGILLLGVGTVLFLERLGYWFPHWLFSWPMLLIVIGLFVGFKHHFHNPIWFILVVIGSLFLAESVFPYFHMRQFLWPIVIILFGLWMIFGKHRHPGWHNHWKHHGRDQWRKHWDGHWEKYMPETDSGKENFDVNSPTMPGEEKKTFFQEATEDDYLESVSVFGGNKRIILSKNFRGGDVVTFMGGCEINLSQADIQGRAELEVTQVLGGTRIIVPANWEVKSENMTAVFGAIEDKRIIQPGTTSPDKVLIIRGTSVFGGIDICSF